MTKTNLILSLSFGFCAIFCAAYGALTQNPGAIAGAVTALPAAAVWAFA